MPPLPPPPRPVKVPWFEVPFTSRRNIVITLAAGLGLTWFQRKFLGPVQFADKPDIPFSVLGYTDMNPDDFVYFKTQGGHWVAAAEDEQNRLFMIDEIGDLYYDSGTDEVGLYAMDTRGNLYNFYRDLDGEQKITPVGNVSELKKFNVTELAGVKLDKEVGVVAFRDGREIPLPPGTGFMDKNGKFTPPGELLEGYTRSVDDGPIARLFKRSAAESAPERLELDLNDPKPFKRQLFDQVLLDDPDIAGFQPALPDDFDINELAKEIEEGR